MKMVGDFTMNDNSEKVDLANLYREVAICVGQEDNKQLKKILEKIKKQAAKGLFSIKIEVDEDVHDWVFYQPYPGNRIKPDLISKLEEYGFICGSPKKDIGVIFDTCTIIVSWQNK